jgi:hypothetical protein
VTDPVNHPEHYGGEGNPYEAIRVIEAWDLGFCLGNAVKYIARAGKKGSEAVDIDKAIWYLKRHRDNLAQSVYVPHPGEVVTLKRVYIENACYYADTDKGGGVRLPLSHGQDPPQEGDRVTVGEEGFTYIENAGRSRA